MARLSRQTKEIIKTVLVLALVALLVIAYFIYPLNRTKAMMARDDVDNYNPDSLGLNDPTAFVDAGLRAETLTVEADGLTLLACVYIAAEADSVSPGRGTVILLHDDGESRDSLLPLASSLNDSGFVVIAYDQRASGVTTGAYRGCGYLEANDLEAVISYLEIRNRIVHPLYIVGFGLGADAAMMAVAEEQRIDGLVGIEPYLTTQRLQNVLREEYQAYWFPFYRTIMWWWYKIRSGYAPVYTKIDDIAPVTRRTLIMVAEDSMSDPEIVRLKDVSEPGQLEIRVLPESDSLTFAEIVGYLTR